MAKSTGNAYTREEIEARGFEPMALRYFYTTALYRSRLNFTFRALQAAQTSLERLRNLAYQLLLQSDQARVFAPDLIEASVASDQGRPWQQAFLAEVENDLNMPRAMAVVWSLLRTPDLPPVTKLHVLFDLDRILGFGFNAYLQSDEPRRRLDPQAHLAAVPTEVAAQVEGRGHLRSEHVYAQADQVRATLNQSGFQLRDTAHGSLIDPRRLDEEFAVLASSLDAPDHTQDTDRYDFSINRWPTIAVMILRVVFRVSAAMPVNRRWNW